MTTFTVLAWVAAGAGVVLVLLLAYIRRRSAPPDMGSVSEQWVVEHRLGQSDRLR